MILINGKAVVTVWLTADLVTQGPTCPMSGKYPHVGVRCHMSGKAGPCRGTLPHVRVRCPTSGYVAPCRVRCPTSGYVAPCRVRCPMSGYVATLPHVGVRCPMSGKYPHVGVRCPMSGKYPHVGVRCTMSGKYPHVGVRWPMSGHVAPYRRKLVHAMGKSDPLFNKQKTIHKNAKQCSFCICLYPSGSWGGGGEEPTYSTAYLQPHKVEIDSSQMTAKYGCSLSFIPPGCLLPSSSIKCDSMSFLSFTMSVKRSHSPFTRMLWMVWSFWLK